MTLYPEFAVATDTRSIDPPWQDLTACRPACLNYIVVSCLTDDRSGMTCLLRYTTALTASKHTAERLKADL